MSSKEPTLSPKVSELKASANEQFKKGDFKKARALFTEAIGLEKTSPALYSNRSAANVKLQRYDDALKDAQKAAKLDPDWDKAQARVATAQEYLARYQAAFISYQLAATLASDPGQKREYQKSAERMRAKVADSARDRMSTAERVTQNSYEDPRLRLLRLEMQGHTYPPDSAARRFARVSVAVRESWKGCQQLYFTDIGPNGARLPAGQKALRIPDRGYDVLLEHVSNILEDPTNSFSYIGHETWSNPMMLVEAIHQIFYSIPSALKDKNASPARWIRHIDALKQEHGWYTINNNVGARGILAGAIRFRILAGIMQELMIGDYGTALKYYDEAFTMINLARAQWPDEIGPDGCGTSMRRTFKRAVRARMLECKFQVAQKMNHPAKDLREIEAIAQEQIDSCEKHPIPRPADNANESEWVYYVAFDAFIRAESYMALALVHRTRAERAETKKGQSTYIDPREARLAMDNYIQAASWYPEDDRQFPRAVWCAMEMQMRIGGMSLQAMDAMINVAKKSEDDYQRFNGPQDYSGPASLNRTFALNHREQLAKEAKKKGITDPANIILNAIPRVVASGGRSPAIYQAKKQTAPGADKDLDQGGENSARFTIAEVYTNAQRSRADASRNLPSVFVDD